MTRQEALENNMLDLERRRRLAMIMASAALRDAIREQHPEIVERLTSEKKGN